jgi:hypothetical protein
MSAGNLSFEDELAERVEITGFCWLWTAGIDVHGYGWITRQGRKYKAHRWTYENLVGEIATGLVLDHLCRVRNCVNPDHLEAVTSGENSRRGYWGLRRHCPNGHDLTDPQHLHIRPSGWRMCRTCNAESTRRRRRRATA